VSDRQDDPIPRQKLLELVPRRSLVKAVTLLLMLGAIVYFQQHAGRVAEHVNRTLGPLMGNPASTTPAPRPATPKQPVQP
jgi:hypothetical protein